VSRARVVVVGLGPAGAELLAASALELLRSSPDVVLRTRVHPAAAALTSADSFDDRYEVSGSFDEVYAGIVDELVERALRSGEVVYAVPGSPLVAERTVELLRERTEIELVVVPALSFADLAWAALGVDPLATEVRLVDATALEGRRLRGPGPLLVTQVHSRALLSEVKLSIDQDLLDSPTRVVLLHHLGLEDELVVELDLDELDHIEEVDHLTSVYVAELRTVGPAAEDLVDLMARLRAECPWDQRQTHGSLTRHLLEEAYEAVESLEALSAALDAEAADGAAPDDGALERAYEHAAEELGDLVFQVVFHAHLAAEEGRFDLTAVLDGVRRKLIGRHPHVFSDVVAETADEVAANWEDIKRAEKGRSSVTEGIPEALPSLLRYTKLRRKASAIGLVEPQRAELAARLSSALRELESLPPEAADDAEGSSDAPGAAAVGELLAASAELARQAGVDPEMALRRRADALRSEIIAAEARGAATGS
jgi:tetrapyrrole methylase family protein/MazG family protein